jgi:hypothetical protein
MTGAVQNTGGQPRVFQHTGKSTGHANCPCGRSLSPRVACVWSRLLRGSTFHHCDPLIHWSLAISSLATSPLPPLATSPNLTSYRFETPKLHPQHGEPPIEVRVPDTSRDGRAGWAPLTPRRAPGAPKCARWPCNDTQEIAKSFWSYFYGGLS